MSVSHDWFGWGVFAVGLVLFFGLTTLFGPPSLLTIRLCNPLRPAHVRSWQARCHGPGAVALQP